MSGPSASMRSSVPRPIAPSGCPSPPHALLWSAILRPIFGLALLAAVGCAVGPDPSPDPDPNLGRNIWDGTIRTWGTLREVLRDGDRSGKVSVTDVLGPATHGIGALADLDGEIAIRGGAAFVAEGFRLDRHTIGGPVVMPRPATGEDRAALLAVCEVPRWRSIAIDRPLDERGLERLVREHWDAAAFGATRVVPVQVEGPIEWRGHVLAGRCPHSSAPPPPGSAPPVTVSRTTVRPSTLVGFLSDLGPGVLTHHGTVFHLHAVPNEGDGGGGVAHVDAFTVEPGATLRIPASGRSR